MKVRYTSFGVLTLFLVLVMNSALWGVDVRDIESVRSKGVLDSGDLQIIDDFVAQAVQELVETKDFTSIAETRTAILARKSSNQESAQAQYAGQFSESANKYIAEALKKAGRFSPQQGKVKVILNLLILVHDLQQPMLAELAVEMLDDENTVVRYWAVRCVTSADMIQQLNLEEVSDLKLAVGIAEKLQAVVEQDCPDIIALTAEFAAGLKIQQGQDLLLKIADVRINKYADWTVDYAFLDSVVLKLLCDKMASTPASKSVIAQRFARLCSYAMQRYIKDISGPNFLSAVQRHQLSSLLVETERTCIGPLLAMPQLVIKRAVEQNDVTALLLEHGRLFGDETRAGRLALKLGFDYGTGADGTKRTAPPVLPQPPSSKVGT